MVVCMSLEIDASQVHVWKIQWDSAASMPSFDLLSPDERERANRFKSNIHQFQYYYSRLSLLRRR